MDYKDALTIILLSTATTIAVKVMQIVTAYMQLIGCGKSPYNKQAHNLTKKAKTPLGRG